jgi:hypothetical protein
MTNTRPKNLTAKSSRLKKAPSYRSFRLSSRITPDSLKKLPTTRQLWRETWIFLWAHRLKMLHFVAIYTIFYLLLVKGLSNLTFDVEILKEELQSLSDGQLNAVFTVITIYWSLLTSTTINQDQITNYLQISVVAIFSLAYIWLLRKLHIRNSTATVKQAFYNGMRPLIPFMLVSLVIVAELLPAGIASVLYISAQVSAISASELELLGVTVAMLLSLVLTIYLLSGSIFALYIVTLPDVTPIQALRSSMKLLRIHRWLVLRKIVGFYVTLVILGFFLVLPFIIWLPRYSELAFFILSTSSFAVMHTFMYKLYRSLL